MADCLHLQPKHSEVLEALLREHLPDVEVWAYGSRVNGRGHDGSDLDLVEDPAHGLGSTARREFCILVDVHPGLASRFADRISSPISFQDQSWMDNLLRDHS